MSFVIFEYETITPYGSSFQKILLTTKFVTHPFYKRGDVVLQPLTYSIAGTHSVWASLGSLAATTRMLDLVYFPPGTKMFQFPGCASTHLSVLII